MHATSNVTTAGHDLLSTIYFTLKQLVMALIVALQLTPFMTSHVRKDLALSAASFKQEREKWREREREGQRREREKES